MKSKRATKIAHGVMAKSVVLRGGKEKTAGGLTKASLMKNKRGKAVSKKQHAAGKKAFKHIQDCQQLQGSAQGSWIHRLRCSQRQISPGQSFVCKVEGIACRSMKVVPRKLCLPAMRGSGLCG